MLIRGKFTYVSRLHSKLTRQYLSSRQYVVNSSIIFSPCSMVDRLSHFYTNARSCSPFFRTRATLTILSYHVFRRISLFRAAPTWRIIAKSFTVVRQSSPIVRHESKGGNWIKANVRPASWRRQQERRERVVEWWRIDQGKMDLSNEIERYVASRARVVTNWLRNGLCEKRTETSPRGFRLN